MRGSDCTEACVGTNGNAEGTVRPACGFSGTSPAAIVYVVSKLIRECRIIGQFVLEIMTRKFVLIGAAVAVVVTLTNVILAGVNDYVFEPVKTEIKSSNVAIIAVRLLHKPGERPVTDAVIVQTRIVMAHDGGTEMDAAFVPLASPEPGVYAFRAPLTMAGKLFLSIAAKVPCEPETVVGKIIFRVTP
jgi:hypothetical protein